MSDEIQEIDGIPIRTEQIGFDSTEMIACGHCRKSNPPNRLDCLYCGNDLELPTSIASEIQLRHAMPELWEPGVNVIVTGGVLDSDRETILKTLSIDAETLEKAFGCEPPFPLVRTNEEDAEAVIKRLQNAGLVVRHCMDRSLNSDQPPTRLRGIVFDSGSVELLLFNRDVVKRFDNSAISLVVSGSILETESESTVKRKRKETMRFGEHISSSDHAVIDLYAKGEVGGFRILPHGFDFSCLGDRKSLLAVENVQTLKDMLRANFSNSVFDESYGSKMPLLDSVWPRTVTNTSKGFHRVGARVQRSVGEAVSNADQFTRYSRMRRGLL